jgi:hypothetical protein
MWILWMKKKNENIELIYHDKRFTRKGIESTKQGLSPQGVLCCRILHCCVVIQNI